MNSVHFMVNENLQIPNRLAAALPWLEIFLMFKDKRHEEIDDHRGTYRKEGEVNKIHADPCWFDRKFLTPPVAHAERACLEPGGYSVDEFYFGHDLSD